MFLTHNTSVWLSASPVDMRKGIYTLSVIVVEQLKLPPGEGDLFIFYNRHYNRLKILFWQQNGFCLFYKKLERGRFKIPVVKDKMNISSQQLRWLLDGLDFQKIKGHPTLKYHYFY
jgi:transposase